MRAKVRKKKEVKEQFETQSLTQVDLEKNLLEGANITQMKSIDTYKKITSWVVFSDLHVQAKTCKTAMLVLERVLQEAQKRNAGIMFLGDFWDKRGQIPVEPLIQVCKVFEKWDIPTIMIPGNHDQVSLGDLNHSLKPLASIRPDHIMTIDQPSIFLNALFLPYRSDQQIKLILEQFKTQYKNSSVKAVFAHISVEGAQWNNSSQSFEGIEKDSLPSEIPIYTGHYHKPHYVTDTNALYVGSPYQVNWGEEGQQKYLYILDKNFQIQEKVEINIGQQFVKVTLDDYSSDEQYAIVQDKIKQLNSGDFIHIACRDRENSHIDLDSIAKEINEKGLNMQVTIPPQTSTARLPDNAKADPNQSWKIFCSKGSISKETQQKGLEVLKVVVASMQTKTQEVCNVEFQKLTFEGYGPFKQQAAYNYGMDKQSGVKLKLLCGKNNDSEGMESNGSGKSMLANAYIYALAGKLDIQSPLVRKKVDVVNETSQTAFIQLEGLVNNKPFRILRSYKKPSKSSLQFFYDNNDCTTQDSRITQARIDETFQTDKLAMTVYAQLSSSLLEATDKELKLKIGILNDVSLWENSETYIREQITNFKEWLQTLQVENSHAKKEIESISSQQESLKSQYYTFEFSTTQEKNILSQQQVQIKSDLFEKIAQVVSQTIQLQLITQIMEDQQTLDSDVQGNSSQESQILQMKNIQDIDTQVDKDSIWQKLDNDIRELSKGDTTINLSQQITEKTNELKSLDEHMVSYRTQTDQVNAIRTSLLDRIKKYEHLKLINRSSMDGIQNDHSHEHSHQNAGTPGTLEVEDGALICDTCHQPIENATYDQIILELRSDEQEQVDRFKTILGEFEEVKEKALTASKELDKLRGDLHNYQNLVDSKFRRENQIYLEQEQRRRKHYMELERTQKQKDQVQQQKMQEMRSRMALLATLNQNTKQCITFIDQLIKNHTPLLNSIYTGVRALGIETVKQQYPFIDSTQSLKEVVGAFSKQAGTHVKLQDVQDENLRQYIASNDNKLRLQYGQGEEKKLEEIMGRIQNLSRLLYSVQEQVQEHVILQEQEKGINQRENPYSRSLEINEKQLVEKMEEAEDVDRNLQDKQAGLQEWVTLHPLFSRKGIQHFLIEQTLNQLQRYCNSYLQQLDSSMTLILKAFDDDKEESSVILKDVAFNNQNGTTSVRGFRQISSGERQRIGLCFALAYINMIKENVLTSSNLLILDEVMTHVDPQGQMQIFDLLRSYQDKHILVVGQAQTAGTMDIDVVDWVVKQDGASKIELSVN